MESSQVMLGINNRDLQTFIVDIENNRRIMESSAGQQVCCPGEHVLRVDCQI